MTLTKVKNACRRLLFEDPSSQTIQPNGTSNDVKQKQENDNQRYDVFISYSHKQEPTATHFLSLLEERDPKLKIFFDRTGLKTGNVLTQM